MPLGKLSDFLGKYLALKPPTEVVRQILIEAIAGTVGITLDPSQVRIEKDGTAFIKGSPALKSQIFMQKGLIIEKILSSSQRYVIRDIR